MIGYICSLTPTESLHLSLEDWATPKAQYGIWTKLINALEFVNGRNGRLNACMKDFGFF